MSLASFSACVIRSPLFRECVSLAALASFSACVIRSLVFFVHIIRSLRSLLSPRVWIARCARSFSAHVCLFSARVSPQSVRLFPAYACLCSRASLPSVSLLSVRFSSRRMCVSSRRLSPQSVRLFPAYACLCSRTCLSLSARDMRSLAHMHTSLSPSVCVFGAYAHGADASLPSPP